MRLSEFSLHESIIDAINRMLSFAEAKDMFNQLYESIKGNNTLVDNFMETHRTSLPLKNHNYYPISAVFMIGQDRIELQYSGISLKFVDIQSEYFIYTNGNQEEKFPPEYKLTTVAVTTFHCTTLEESKELRAVIYMAFGDCNITEIKL